MQAVNSAIRDVNGTVDGDEAEPDEIDQNQSYGIIEPLKVDHEEEYVDEDRLTTVTVEAVEVSRDGLHRIFDEDEQGFRKMDGPEIDDASFSTTGKEKAKNGMKRIWTKERPGEKRRKKKKFKYESKAERKVTRYKERSGNKAKAKSRRE